MILQRDKWIAEHYPMVKDGGCYFFSLIWFAVLYRNISVTPQVICEDIYLWAVDREYMKQSCYIREPESILSMLGLNVEYIGHRPVDYQCKQTEFEVLKYHHRVNGWDHFVAGDGHGVVTYDPWGAVEPYDCSITVAEGVLESKRIFRR